MELCFHISLAKVEAFFHNAVMATNTKRRAMKVTYAIAMAAGRDAANRNMAAAGRTSWNEDDWNVAAETFARLMGE